MKSLGRSGFLRAYAGGAAEGCLLVPCHPTFALSGSASGTRRCSCRHLSESLNSGVAPVAGAGRPPNVSHFAVGRWLGWPCQSLNWPRRNGVGIQAVGRPGSVRVVRGTGPRDGMDSLHLRDCDSELVADAGNRHTGGPPGGCPSVPSCSRLPMLRRAWRSRYTTGTGMGPPRLIHLPGALDGAVLVALVPVMLLACRGLPATFRPRPVTKARAYRIATTISRNR